MHSSRFTNFLVSVRLPLSVLPAVTAIDLDLDLDLDLELLSSIAEPFLEKILTDGVPKHKHCQCICVVFVSHVLTLLDQHSRTLELEQYLTISCKVPSGKFWLNQRSITFPRHGYLEFYKPAKLIYHMHRYWRHSSLRAFTGTVSLDKDPLSFSQVESASNELDSNNEELLSQKAESDEVLSKRLGRKPEDIIKLDANENPYGPPPELKSLLADSERGKLLQKLSEANQYNRFLRRQLIAKDDALVNFKSELAISELELQALIGLAEEMANSGPPIVSRKINGKYITSHLLSRLTAVHEKVKAHTKDIDSVKVKDIELFWGGMAESVQVMGSFDGWTQGEEMSPVYTGSYTIFSVTMRLRPGRYEIKYLVDGEWQISPELPIVGEVPLINNLLMVE